MNSEVSRQTRSHTGGSVVVVCADRAEGPFHQAIRVALSCRADAGADAEARDADASFDLQPAGSRESLRDALDLACRRTWPAVVVADLLAFGADAGELIENVRERWPQIPVIIVTARGSEERAATLLAAGAGAYVINRGDRVPELGRAIRETLAHHAEQLEGRRAIAERRFSRAHLDLVMSAGNIGIFDWDLESGRVIWQGKLEEMMGLAPGEFGETYESFAQCLHPDDVPEVERAVAQARVTRAIFEQEYRSVARRTGTLRWLVARGRFLYGPTGQAYRMIGVVMDLTPFRLAEQTAQRQLAQIAQLQRANLLSLLASGLAHELNQPLSVIANCAGAALQMAANGVLPKAQAAAIFDEVNREAQRAGQIIRRLRDFIRRTPPESMRCDLNEVVREALGLMAMPLRQAGVQVTFEPAADLPPVLLDRVQIQQVLVNLIQNAIEAMQGCDGSRICELTVSVARLAGRARVRVWDNGPGIRAEDHDRLFESFFSTKTHHLGMGLAISRSIVESHGGCLALREVQGMDPPQACCSDSGGTTFEFTLPIYDTVGDAEGIVAGTTGQS